ncbi:hypothetical protein Q4F19_16775 [Sphingomonas sp. BIUV-7]|uniref:PNPLA domain-containing protein n=1 Tax=Sphingomonas natans TaxID=3063330 RepID=A0ABT8YCH4_9SPHN|nr:hypothetical protein [Sphingomonas sp. BIUV-7]MDO6416046.1 hypothetical protein [Sphingomonas sp. BIUV-7]
MPQEGAKTVAVPATALESVKALIDRRRRVRIWWGGDDAWSDAADPQPPVGLAFSGGGIRSATFCLGLIQGLAQSPRDALSKIDVLSTVSGGGYAGVFLRSLFVPASRRGIKAQPVLADDAVIEAIAEQYAFARAALASAPNQQELSFQAHNQGKPRTVRNPMWWLREHSRYLAPNGPTDFSFAIAYLARNWLAMVYLFVLACTAVATVTVAVEAGLLGLLGWVRGGPVGPLPASPLFGLALIPIVQIVALVIGYWGTQAMSANEPSAAKQHHNLNQTLGRVAVATAAAAVVLLVALIGVAWWYAEPLGQAVTRHVGRFLTGAVVLGIVAASLGAATDRYHADQLKTQGTMLTAELRARLTNRLARANLLLGLIVGAGLIDSLAAMLNRLVEGGVSRTLLAGMLPVFAFLIKKLPDWFGGTGKSAIKSLVKRFATTTALVFGLVLYGLLAVAATALVHHAAWSDTIWTDQANWPRLIVLLALAWLLAIVSGKAEGFINLSSLHTLYSARLTRAYLGAGNIERLALPDVREDEHPVRGGHVRTRDPVPVNENHAGDYIQPRVYGELDLPAPIHIINVTINETLDLRSQIVARDRKGDIMSLEPGGVRIGRQLADWRRLTNDPPDPDRSHAENVSLGQWIAISGAAASSAMGRMTSLGFALAFTFANVRLGYWWWAPRMCEDVPQTLGFKGWVAQNFATFVYLANEMTCRYSRGYDRKYLTDGGHYENSGAYPLIRRRVPFIIVSDNGADPDYAFEDLQTLVRQTRIDLGGETMILEGVELADQLAILGVVDASVFVDPAADPDWRASMIDARSRPFILLLRVTLGDDVLHLLWIKPRLLPGMPADVAGYAATMPPFPQQPTGDQFFDEAQWESYRRLGEEAMRRLLAACPRLLADPVPVGGRAGATSKGDQARRAPAVRR